MSKITDELMCKINEKCEAIERCQRFADAAKSNDEKEVFERRVVVLRRELGELQNKLTEENKKNGQK